MGGANNAFCSERRDTFVMHSPHRGGPDKLSSLRNNHMTILHSSLHKYILAVHDLHCIPRYISTYT